MTTTETKPAAPAKTQLNRATRQLLYLAATLPCLARKMNLRLVNVTEPDQEPALQYHRHVPWLIERHGELVFDPDKFKRCLGPRSTGEHLCALFLLNVWNANAARDKRWRFDLFDFISTCGSSSAETDAVIAWMKHPVWP